LSCISVTNGNMQPRALTLGVSSEGAVVERNRTYFLVESGVWQIGDKIRLTLSQGEADADCGRLRLCRAN
jgi:hypothetical protein